jgi:glucokinase
MPLHQSDELSLVADIGGTNTRVALTRGAELQAGTVRRYRNAGHAGLEPVLQQYLQELDRPAIAGACIALAGPVRNGAGEMTNLDWKIDCRALSQATGARRCDILNDLQAQGYALGHVGPEHVTPVFTGQFASPAARAPSLVIGIGTGFNIAPVIDFRGGRIVMPSETGHINLPLHNEQDQRLNRFLTREFGFPALESALSGRGLQAIYAAMMPENTTITAPEASSIMAALQEKSDPVAEQAARQFVSLLGAVTGTLALIQLPFNGIYLVGGVARAFAPWLEEFNFATAFRDKGRFSEFMENFSVSLINDDYAALTGCAVHLDKMR